MGTIKNSNPMRDVKKMQIVWAWEPWGGRPIKMCVKDIDEKVVKLQGFVRNPESQPGSTGRALDEIWPTKEALLEDKAIQVAKNKEERRRKADAYKKRIPDVESLVRFMFEYQVTIDSGGCANWAARMAAAERAKELLGISLEE